MPLLSPVSDAGDQQQFHQERNIRRPENSSEEVLEHSPASLPSIPLSPRPVSNRRPIIIQQSPPINQQSSAALVPPASASVVISHHKESPYRDLSRNIADQGEDASNVDSLPQTALEEDTQEANKTSTEKSSRRQSISSSLQGPKAPAEANLPSKRGVVVTQASTKPREKGPSTRENEERGDSSISQKHQYKRRESTAEKDHGKATEDYRRAKRASSDLDKGIPPAQEGVPTNIDLRSDSGYSSYTAAPVSSTMSAEYVPPQHRQYQVTEVPPRARSPRSNITTYRRSDPRSISPKPQVVRPVNNEIRLRVDANAPLSLQFIGNMEGRTMQLIPAEDGMADLIISGGDSDALGTVGNSNDQQERTQQNRRSKVGSYPRPPAAFESSSEYESEEDETYESHDEYGTEMFGGGEMGIRSSKGKSDSVYGIGTTTRTNRLSRRPSVSRLTPRREIQTEYPTSRSSFYENEPVEAVPLPHPRKPGYFQGAAVIQPAITRPRRPTVGRLTGYLTRTGPQNHWSRESSYYRSQRHGPPSSSSTAFSRSSQGSYYVESASNRERARGRELQQPSYKVGSRRVDTKRSDISPYPTRVTGKLNSPTIRPAPMPPINLRHPGLSEITSRPKSISRKALASSKPPTIIQQSEHPWKSTQKSRRVNRGRRSNMQSLEAQKTEKAPLRSERDETLTQERDEKSEILKSQKEEKYGYWDPRAGDSSISTRQRPEVITSQNQPGEPGYWHSFDDSDSGLSTPSICSSEGENTAIFGLSAPSANEARKLSGESSPSQIRQDVPIAAVKVRPALEYVVETPRGFAFENMKSPSDTQSLLPKDPNPGLKAYEGDSEPPSPTSQHPQPTSDLENSQQARVAPNTPASIEALGNIMTRSDKEIVLPSTTATPFTDNSIPSLITVKGGEYASEIISVPPSHAAMVSPISVESLPTLTSGISKSDGYSAVEIAAATKVLLSVLYEDDCLMHLCEIAIENQNIGRERLQKKLRRSLRACAARLYDNAKITTKRVEYLAAQLIHAKSAFLAQYIAKMLQDKRENAQLLHYERGNQSSEEEDDKRSVQHSIEKVFSNETFRKFMENNRIDLDPWVEEDLCTLREIVASSAFGHVSNQVAELVVPYLPRMESTEPVVEDTSDCDATGTQNGILVLSELFRPTLTWYEWFRHGKQTLDFFTSRAYQRLFTISRLCLTPDTMLHARNQFLVAMGLLEPALDQNKVRLRWPCVSLSCSGSDSF